MSKKKWIIGVASAVGIGVAIAAVAKIVYDKKKKKKEEEFDSLLDCDEDFCEDEMEEKFEQAFEKQRIIRENADKKSCSTCVCSEDNFVSDTEQSAEV